MTDIILLTGGGICLVLLVYAGLQLLPQQAQTRKNEHRLLGEIAWLWTGRSNDVVDFREIARIWRITPEVRDEPLPPPEYGREEIRQFHFRWVTLPTVQGEKKRIIEKILSILDRQGDCPSVVQRNKNEAESKYDQDVFQQLAQIPLWQHSLAVASNLADSMKQAVMIPDALIAGLGHDLGKIPAYQETLYRTGDHPILSLIVLNRIPGYESMSNLDDISQAIRQHHQLAPETPLGVALKKADKKTRLEEISRIAPTENDPPQEITEKSGKELPPSPNIEETGKVKHGVGKEKGKEKEKNVQPPKQDRRPADNQKKKSASRNKKVKKAKIAVSNKDRELAEKLELNLILDALKKRIDKVEKGRWSVISTPEGIVLCQPDALWWEIKNVDQNNPELLAGDADEATRRKIIGAVVKRMDQEFKAIETSHLGKGYYTVQCLVITANGKALKIPLIPFRGEEAFNLLPSQLEVSKLPNIKRLVQMVKLPNQIRKDEA